MDCLNDIFVCIEWGIINLKWNLEVIKFVVGKLVFIGD